MQYTNNQENVRNSHRTDDKQMSTQDDADVGTSKDFKATIITMLHDIKKNTLEMKENVGLISRKTETIKKNQIKLQD